MKKALFLLSVAACMLTSCHTIYQSASTQAVPNGLHTDVYAKMEVSQQKISYTYYTDKSVRRGGMQNCVNMAIHEALKSNGNADVLVQSEEAIIKRKGMFGSKIKSVTVTGYPAKYTQFESR